MRSYYTDEERLLDDTLFLLFAGHETTSHSLTTGVYRLIKHPECRERLRTELNQLLKEKSLEHLTLSEINSIEYLHMFIKECLRIETAIV